MEPLAYRLLSKVVEQLRPEGGFAMKKFKLAVVTGLLAGALSLPGATVLADGRGRGHDRDHERGHDRDHGHGDKHGHGHKHSHFHIPPGHMPPAGMCRVWIPGRPPGHQPPPGDCRVLSRQVPRRAYLIAYGDRRWSYDDVHYHHSRGEVYDARGYFRRQEIRNDIREVRQARHELREDQEQLQKNRDELRKDRAELRRDIRNGASKKEIRQDRREILADKQKIADSRREVRQSQNRLDAARAELRDDLRRR